ncbi:MAG: serine/threonine protein kinase, partial [Verrucomicrobiota bacterium]|nr:serine/threonine protein kinase [Verrucomicrobiota bacterium]
MAEASEALQQECPACRVRVDVAEAEPLANVACPACGEKMRVQSAFDNFFILETLGVGGMGAVYKARDTRLDRFVALKLLRKELSADPAEAARLEQEARVTASVNHPNVVQVYSAGRAHGQIYLVMELVDQGSLDDLMAHDTRVPEEQVLAAGIQVAKGLQAAYEKGLIHRDVKPANILFSQAKVAKIGDFGLAGVAEQKGEARQEIWGTPYYVAPERLNNEPEDFRSDIYSLGATLFHALAGRPPMEGDSTSATELRLLKAHPPDLHSVAPEVARETSKVINRMLAPKPANRFTSYGHLINALQRAARGLPSVSASGVSDPRLGKLGLKIAVAAVLLAILATAGFLFLKPKRVPTSTAAQTAASVTPDNTAALQQ